MLVKLDAAHQTPNGGPSAMIISGNDKTPFTDDFNEYLREILEHFHLPSLSIAVIDGDETYIKSHGTAILPDTPATPDTLYYIGSTTKAFTTVSLLSVLEEQSESEEPVTLKKRISFIIPSDFVLPDEYATAHATIEDALCHRLGFSGHDLSYGGKEFEDFSVRDAVRSFRHLSMKEEFRSKFQYWNMGYMLVQHIVETLTGKWIGDVHKERIWVPLGMDSTFILPGDVLKAGKQLAHCYSWGSFQEKQIHQPWTDTPLVGEGGIMTSITDFAKYLRAVIDHKLPLSESSQKDLHQPRMVAYPPQGKHFTHDLYALGWEISSYRGNDLVQHAGEYVGCAATLKLLPNKRWGIAILTNGDDNGSSVCEFLSRRLMDDHLGIPKKKDCEDIVPKIDAKDQEKIDFYKNARSILYPDIPSTPFPSTLPLSAYAGSYTHPAYRTINFELAKPRPLIPVAEHTTHVLHAHIHRVISIVLDLEHVSGEFFIMWGDLEQTSPVARMGMKAQFTIGSSEKVEKLGIHTDFGAALGDDRMLVWLDRV